jgi:hypothetical protein
MEYIVFEILLDHWKIESQPSIQIRYKASDGSESYTVSGEGTYPPEDTDPPAELESEDKSFSRLGDALIEAGKLANAREEKTWHIDGKQWSGNY